VKLFLPVTALLGVVVAIVLTARGGDDGLVDIRTPGPPVGAPLLPDIAPGAPQDARMTREDGRWMIRFSTILANIGDGDFVLRATRRHDGWQVDQDVHYSKSGAKVYRTPAGLVWAGDGHNHWHVRRIAIGRLEPYTKDGRPPPNDGRGLTDTKIGFCYYDLARLEEDASQNPVFPHEGCGTATDTEIGMGLSWGWMDIYGSKLPGQTIDVTDVPDGTYRLWISVDRNGWFHEKRRDNNVTWVDLDIVSDEQGSRDLQNIRSGPAIRLRD
jgi:Lysyl oxidase